MILYIAVLCYLILLVFRKQLGIVCYTILASTVYLFSLSFIQTLDVTLPVYLFFILLPNLKYFKVKSQFQLLVLYYFFCIIVFSAIKNGIAASISIFIIRLIGIFLFCFIYDGIPTRIIQNHFKTDADYLRVTRIIVLSELFVLLLAYFISGGDSSTRFMLNYQCTIGCISTGCMLLLSFFLSTSVRKRPIWAAMVITLCTTIFSGTRGYIIVVGGIFAVSLLYFIADKKKIILALLGVGIALVLWQYIFELFYSQMRFGESTGRRASENLFLVESLSTSPWYNVILGHGFGCPLVNVPDAESIISAVSNSDYTYYILHHVNAFHNCWLTVCYSAGIIGFILILILYFSLFKKVRIRCSNSKIRLCIYTFLVTYFVLLWYRWSATSGILEFFVVEIVLKLTDKDCYYSTNAQLISQ